MAPQLRWAVFGGWVVLTFCCGFRADAGFTVVDLGPAGAGLTGAATAVNASGQTAGIATTAGGANQAVFAAGGGGFQAVNLSGLSGVASSVANSINANNNLVGTFYDSVDRTYHAFKTMNGHAIDLGSSMSGPLRGADTFGVGITATGEVVGTARLTNGTEQVFRSDTPGQLSQVGLPGGSQVGQAAGVNSGGTVVGSYLNAQGVSRVFTADGNSGVDLLTQYSVRGFGSNTYGSAVNDKGGVTGYGDFGGAYHSFYAVTDPTTGAKTFVDIGLAGGSSSTVSIGLNDRGQIVGRMGNQNSSSRAFFWDQADGLLDLNTLISATEQAHWTLTVAAGINDSGQIAGQGYLNGQLHGFLLIPVPGTLPFFPLSGAVPAPPSAWLALGGLALFAAGGISGAGKLRAGMPLDDPAQFQNA